MTAEVTPERILKDLSALWVSLGKQDAAGVVRACAMTLIVAAEESEDESQIGELLAELVHDHPSRAIVVRARLSTETFLEARVFAQCWMPFGKRQQICCEQIEIVSSEPSLRDVPRVVMGLLAPDLPVVLVCRSARLFQHAAFAPFLDLSGKVIVDSRRAEHPLEFLRAIAARIAHGHATGDLAWTALTPWREAVALVFDSPEMRTHLASIERIEVVHGGGDPGVEARYLAAWLERTAHAKVEFMPGEQNIPVQAIRMFHSGLLCSWERHGTCLVVRHETAERKLPFGSASDRDLLQEELGILDRDQLFELALERAIAVGGST